METLFLLETQQSSDNFPPFEKKTIKNCFVTYGTFLDHIFDEVFSSNHYYLSLWDMTFDINTLH